MIIYQQEFNVNGMEVKGKLKKSDDDYYMSIENKDKELQNALYSGALDELSIISEMEILVDEYMKTS